MVNVMNAQKIILSIIKKGNNIKVMKIPTKRNRKIYTSIKLQILLHDFPQIPVSG